MADLEANRAAELEQVLAALSKKIIDYVKLADSPEGKVGTYADPKALAKSLNVTVSEKGQGLKGLLDSTDILLENSVATWHKAFLEKLYAGTNPVGVASDLLLSILNTNSHVFTASPAMTIIEKYIGHKYASLFGFSGRASGGLTFPGGSYSNMTSMHMARSILHPETRLEGNPKTSPLAVFASAHAHYSVEKSAIMLGLGSKSVYKVKVHEDGRIDIGDLDKKITEAKEAGAVPFYVNVTAGSTVYGSFDDIEAASNVIAKHGGPSKIWLHVDGSWGGNVVFSRKQKHKLNGSEKAQSLTVNPHKMLGVPCTCSFLLVPNVGVFQKANSLQAPYLFHNSGDDDDDNYDLADGTMGCGRRPDALKLYLSWQWYGSAGFEARIDHAFEMTAYLANKIQNTPGFTMLSTDPPPCLQTCFFYSPNGHLGTKEENTQITRSIARAMFERSKFLVDYSPHPELGEFFRVVINAPSVDKALVDDLVSTIQTIGKTLQPLSV